MPIDAMWLKSASANPGCCASIRKLVGTPSAWVRPIARSVITDRNWAGSKLRTTTLQPPVWKVGLA